jgi:synaptobrevin homolog YKT6
LLPNIPWISKFLPAYLSEYQDPREVDAVNKVQGEVDATKIILKNNIEALNRGENLEDLLKRSENVSDQAKYFAKSAKKMNACCNF